MIDYKDIYVSPIDVLLIHSQLLSMRRCHLGALISIARIAKLVLIILSTVYYSKLLKFLEYDTARARYSSERTIDVV